MCMEFEKGSSSSGEEEAFCYHPNNVHDVYIASRSTKGVVPVLL